MRPGRISAGSSFSGWFEVIIIITPCNSMMPSKILRKHDKSKPFMLVNPDFRSRVILLSALVFALLFVFVSVLLSALVVSCFICFMISLFTTIEDVSLRSLNDDNRVASQSSKIKQSSFPEYSLPLIEQFRKTPSSSSFVLILDKLTITALRLQYFRIPLMVVVLPQPGAP